MPKVAPIDQRKADHIKINLEKDVRSALRTGLENYHFIHQALPELNLNRIDTSLKLFDKQLAAPILISSMTGGTTEAETINLRLAEAAQETGVAMGVGSQRAAIEHPEQAATFQVRRVAPDILLFPNLGAVQLNYGYGIDHCRRAVDMIMRGQGIASRLLASALEHARALPGVSWVHLSVSSAAPVAHRLYERAGLRVWGSEPDALRHDGESLVEHHMALRLRE